MARFGFAAFPGGLGGFAIGMVVAVGIGYLLDYLLGEGRTPAHAEAQAAGAAHPAGTDRHRGMTVLKRPPPGYRPSALPHDDPNPCCVCTEHSADTVVYPCAHLHLCWECFAQLQQPTCPYCRERVDIVAFNFK